MNNYFVIRIRDLGDEKVRYEYEFFDDGSAPGTVAAYEQALRRGDVTASFRVPRHSGPYDTCTAIIGNRLRAEIVDDYNQLRAECAALGYITEAMLYVEDELIALDGLYRARRYMR